jgi:hypothetical protein
MKEIDFPIVFTQHDKDTAAVNYSVGLEPYNKFSTLLAKKICYLKFLSPLCRGLRSAAGLEGSNGYCQAN